MSSSTELKHLLCEQWCTDLEVGEDTAGWRLSLPLNEPDGDAVTVWLNSTIGGWKIHDCGSTIMRLSYEMDVDLLNEGSRAKVLMQLLDEGGMKLHNGEIIALAPENHLGETLLRFGQTIIRIGDIKLWSRNRIASTFYEDLDENLTEIVGEQNIVRNYAPEGIPNSSDYLIDFSIKGGNKPFYIFGVLNSDKAKLTTIILQYLRQNNHIFDSLVVPSDIDQINKKDLRRLMNAANEIIDSGKSIEALKQKVKNKINN